MLKICKYESERTCKKIKNRYTCRISRIKTQIHSRTGKGYCGCYICYALSPVDLIPDFVPVLGYLDDVILLPALIVLTIKLIPDDVWAECLEKSEGMRTDGKPKKWYYAVTAIIIWAVIIWLVVKAVWF